jgi:hypothetical protein
MNSIFKELLEELINGTDLLIEEFANIGPRSHKWGVDVKLHLMQPEDKKLQHAPRIKVFRGSWTNYGENFTITLTEKPFIVGDYKKVVTSREMKMLMNNVVKYRIPLLNFWYDSHRDLDELRDQMDIIDAGGVVKKEYV